MSEEHEPREAAPTPTYRVVLQSPVAGRWMALIGWTGFLVCALVALSQYLALSDYFDTTAGLTEGYHSGARYAADKIAIIEISGLISSGSGFAKQQIDRVREDENVKAVVLRVNSPGGTITGSDYLFHHLSKLRESRKVPIVVSMGSLATSGGYYVSMAVGDQEDSIFAEPTTTTGSIGVIIPHYDISGLMGRLDVKDDSLVTHPRKQMLSMTRPITDDHRRILERYLGEALDRFKEIVQRGRPAFRSDPAALDELATGEVFTARQAQANGLVDRVGWIEDAIDRARELAGLREDAVRVVEFKRPATLLELSGLNARQRHGASPFDEWLERTTPRAYYLYTSLPPLVPIGD